MDEEKADGVVTNGGVYGIGFDAWTTKRDVGLVVSSSSVWLFRYLSGFSSYNVLS